MVTDDELAQAVVRITPVREDGSECWSGSGTVLDPAGTILTNAHVVQPDRSCAYDELQVSVTSAAGDPPVPRYVALVHAFDADLDLAVLRVATGLDGPVSERLPFVAVGDSDEVGLGDPITVLGYPGIGGKTITLTGGQVSGFLGSDRVADPRAWIKTSTTMAGGNSGGAALDESGRLIGIPTQVSAGDDVKLADCRVLSDTNGDGVTDSGDMCVPVGGFINALRPVNLAASLLEQAEGADPLALEDMADEPLTDPGLVTNLRFQRADQAAPAAPAVAFPSGTAKICGVFDFEGMVAGQPVGFAWSLDGVADDTRGNTGYEWAAGESGSAQACTGAPGTALPEGLWELSINLTPDGSDLDGWVHVGDDHPAVGLTISNGLDQPICDVHVSPSVATRWGQDRLAPDQVLDPGESVTVEVGTDQYDVLAVTCEGERVTRTKIDVPAPLAITVNPGDLDNG